MLLITVLVTVIAAAEPPVPAPKLIAVYPPGGAMGSTVRVTLAGSDLHQVTGLLWSHPGLTAKVFVPPPPPDKPDDKTQTKDKAQAKDKDPGKAPDKALPEPDTKVWDITVAPTVPAGVYEVWAVTESGGVSNPRLFTVSALAEHLKATAPQSPDTPSKAQTVAVNSVINGRFDKPREVDWYRFELRRGQRVVIACAGEGIDTKMTPAIELFDKADEAIVANRVGPAVAEGAFYYGLGGPAYALVDFTAPDDGAYLVRVHDYEFAGKADEYAYRLTISDRPQIEFAIPAAVSATKASKVTVFGRNLPGGKPDPDVTIHGRPLDKLVVEVRPPDTKAACNSCAVPVRLGTDMVGLPMVALRLPGDAGRQSDPWPLGVTTAAVLTETEPNDTPTTAQTVSVPFDLTGTLGRPGDQDCYVFDAQKGQSLLVEVIASRIGSRADATVLLGVIEPAKKPGDNPTVKYLLDNVDDDTTTVMGIKGGGNRTKFDLRTVDPRTVFNVPADGRYFVQVQDRAGARHAGGRYYYRLAVTVAEPDFRVAVMTLDDTLAACPTVNPGGRTALQILAARLDAMNESITIKATGLPPGLTADDLVLGPGLTQGPLVIAAADDAKPWTGLITLTATAHISGREVSRPVSVGTLLGGNARQGDELPYGRLSFGLPLAVRAVTGGGLAPFRLDVPTPDKLMAAVPGGKLDIPLTLLRRDGFDEAVDVTLFHTAVMPDQNNRGTVLGTIAKGKNDLSASFTVDKKAAYGVYTYAALGSAKLSYSPEMVKKMGIKNPKPVTVSDPTNVFVVHVVPPVELIVEPLKTTAEPGREISVPVALTRLGGADEDVTITASLAKGGAFSAGPLVIKKGQTRGQLSIKIAAKVDGSPKLEGLQLIAKSTVFGGALETSATVPVSIEVIAPPPPAPKPDKTKKSEDMPTSKAAKSEKPDKAVKLK